MAISDRLDDLSYLGVGNKLLGGTSYLSTISVHRVRARMVLRYGDHHAYDNKVPTQYVTTSRTTGLTAASFHTVRLLREK